MGTVGQRQIPAALPPKEATVPIVEEAGVGGGDSGPVWTGMEFEARTMRFVMSRYIYYAIPATNLWQNNNNNNNNNNQSPLYLEHHT